MSIGRRPRIFGIGLNKTGTTSLSRAVEILGMSVIHFVSPKATPAIERALLNDMPIHRYCRHPRLRWALRGADAFFDVHPIVRHFERLEQIYPGSRFILHTRRLGPWLDSREQHVLRNRQRAREGKYVGSWLIVDRESWTRQWFEHHERVRAHFRNRPSVLLEMDVTAGEGWEHLAPFLDAAIPSTPFPRLNAADPEP